MYMQFFRFAHPWLLVAALLTLILVTLYRWRYYAMVCYRHSLASTLKKSIARDNNYARYIPNTLRFGALLVCAFLIGKPQLVDQSSKVFFEGIDIMLVLDVSGSMELFDDLHDTRSRIEVAKQEALNFIDKRENDQIGLVIFGADAVSRCPLTLDKQILKNIIRETNLGVIDAQGTSLSTAIALAVNRLKNAKATSKIMIVLTDGEPTPGDLNPNLALELAKKYGIKIYTIGIGSDSGGFFMHPLFGLQRTSLPVNKMLLSKFAQETGGKFFEAQLPEDIKNIYATIDQLEKTEYETNVFSTYHDLLFPFIWIILVLITFELVLSTLVWFCL